MGSLIKRGKKWSIRYTVAGRAIQEATGTNNRRLAEKLLKLREVEVIEGRYGLPKSKPPLFDDYIEQFLEDVRHPNTRRRYSTSGVALTAFFKGARLSEITADLIEEFKQARLADEIGPATVNRDLATLRRALRLAERRRLIGRHPFHEVEMLEERSTRRQPHIMTFEEEEKVLAVANAHIRMLMVLILETGLRSSKEALAMRWEDVDLVNDAIRVRKSKTPAGERTVPLSSRCKAELVRWRSFLGPEFSEYVFANPRKPAVPLKDVRTSWKKALTAAGLEYFWIYDLRHTLASRLTQAGVSPIFVAQMLGHSSTAILNVYAKAVDEYRRDAIHKLEALRRSRIPADQVGGQPATAN